MFGQMAMHILVNGNKKKCMDSENKFPATDIMKENLSKIKEKDMVHTFIIMGQYLKVNGMKIKCMGLVY